MTLYARWTASGTCGANLTWILDSDGTLTISGTGAMKDYDFYVGERSPWDSKKGQIQNVVIGDGVTTIGKDAFNYSSANSELKTVDLSNATSLEKIGIRAFFKCSQLENIDLSKAVNLKEIGDDAAGDWLFLIDEAHNLPDRARAMYSAAFAKSALTDAKRALGPGKSALKTALQKADRAFREARQAVARKAPRRGSRTGEAPAAETEQTSLLEPPREPAFALPETLFAEDGTVFCTELPTALLKPLLALTAPLQAYLEDHPDSDAHAQLLDLFFAVQDVTRAAERYDEHFVTQLTARGSELYLHLLCLDPAPFVDGSLAKGRAAAFFSATLTPPGYYRSVLGCADARAVALPSPFPAERLGLYCLPAISTRYRHREASVRPISDALAALARSRVGNYLAFFPSYT